MLLNRSIIIHHNYGHSLHMLNNGSWPTYSSLVLLSMIEDISSLLMITDNENQILDIIIFILNVILWFDDITLETRINGEHSKEVLYGIKMGYILFLLSEICLFASFFWAFMYYSYTNPHNNGFWPSYGLIPLNPWELPFINTILLLSSGAFCTAAHHYLISIHENPFNKYKVIIGLITTIILGIIFTIIQIIEYIYCPFDITDGSFACTFFAATTLHGIHVIIGTIFILISTLRLIESNYSTRHHLGLEFSLIYWHLVDFIWLALLIIFYYLPYYN